MPVLIATMASQPPRLDLDHFRACMLLSATGDAIGYKNGSWEFNYRGEVIHQEADALGGFMKLVVDPYHWMVSDDTVMHLATARALLKTNSKTMSGPLWRAFCEEYVVCFDLMAGRAAGPTCARAIPVLKKYQQVSYSPGGGGCGAAMRTMCIGLVWWREEDLKNLIEISINAGRATHNHPTGFLGGVVAALFTSYALRGVPLLDWGHKFLTEAYPLCLEFMQNDSQWADYNNSSLTYFFDKWTYLLNERNLNKFGATEATYPAGFKTDILQREKFYAAKTFAFSGWAGSSGHDAVMLAYDALVGCEGDWSKFGYWGILHGGDNDSTGAIGGAWFGAFYGFQGVPEGHYKDIEMKQELEESAVALLQAAQASSVPDLLPPTSV